MLKLTLKQKTGFSSKLPFTIYDRWGNEFYSSTFVNKKDSERYFFNLPAGEYSYNGILEKLPKPIEQPNIILPSKERNFKPKRYKITFKSNRNKCTIYHDLGVIEFDVAFYKAPIYILYDVYFHELGHNFYKSEHLADLYATKKMLELGFNQSQIARIPLLTLRPHNTHRKKAKLLSLKQKF